MPLDIHNAVMLVIIKPADAEAAGPTVGCEVAFDAVDGFGGALFDIQNASSNGDV